MSTTEIRYDYVNLTPNRSKKNLSRINDILISWEKIGVESKFRLTSLLLVKALTKSLIALKIHK